MGRVKRRKLKVIEKRKEQREKQSENPKEKSYVVGEGANALREAVGVGHQSLSLRVSLFEHPAVVDHYVLITYMTNIFTLAILFLWQRVELILILC